jgi:hypothetical protein
MATFTGHKFRTIGGDLLEEVWDNGGRQVKDGQYVGGGYFRMYRRGGERPSVTRTVGVPGVPAWTYPNAQLRSDYPNRYAFDYTWNGPYPDFDWKAESYGATAWNRMRPDRPDMSILNALYELREVPESLKPRILKYRDGKAWSDYFLAVNFGWLPLLSDCQDFVRTTINMKNRLDQLLRDEGKPVTRRISMNSGFPARNDGPISGESYSVGVGLVTPCYVGVPKYTDTLSVTSKLWGVGQFKYWLPPGPRDWKWRAREILRVYGAYPSPAVVWNAIPWTWLADWFTNVGDVLENIDFTVADRLASNYAFVMRHVLEKLTRTTTAVLMTPSGAPTTVNLTSYLIGETKERALIDPFSPAVTFDSMSPRQAAILGAIGYSRMPSSAGRF